MAFCESLLEQRDRPRSHEAILLVQLAWLRAWKGELEQAHALAESARARYAEIGEAIAIATAVSHCRATIAVLGGDAETAGTLAGAGLEEATRRDDRNWRTHFLGPLAEAAVMRCDYDHALALTEDARQAATVGDVFQALEWRRPRARALAALDQYDDAEQIARGTLGVTDATDCLYAQGEARAVLGEVLAAAGRLDAAATTTEEAATLFERKGVTLLAERARARIATYRGEPGVRAPLGRG